MAKDRRIYRKCALCDEWRVPGTGQKYCEKHKLTRDGDSQSAMAQRAARYSIKVVDLEAMHEEQDNLCAICARPERVPGRSLSVDHDHACCPGDTSCGKCIRGLLCSDCNRGLGFLGDTLDRMRQVVAYLERKKY